MGEITQKGREKGERKEEKEELRDSLVPKPNFRLRNGDEVRRERGDR